MRPVWTSLSVINRQSAGSSHVKEHSDTQPMLWFCALDAKPPPAPSPRHAEEGPSVIRRIHAMPDIGGQPLPRSNVDLE